MQHSAFDLEVHAKHHQGQIQREIERIQQFDAARARGQASRCKPDLGLSRLIEAARAWLTGKTGHASPAPQGSANATETSPSSAAAVPASRSANPIPAGDAYAGLVVIARASSVPVARQPSHAANRSPRAR